MKWKQRVHHIHTMEYYLAIKMIQLIQHNEPQKVIFLCPEYALASKFKYTHIYIYAQVKKVRCKKLQHSA